MYGMGVGLSNTHKPFSGFSCRTPNLGYSFETNSGNPFHYFSYGVACSEVEIDCLTGDHKVRHLHREKRRKTTGLQSELLVGACSLVRKQALHQRQVDAP